MHEGDLLEAEAEDGAIILHPLVVVARRRRERGPRGADHVVFRRRPGGLFKSTEEIDAYIRRERDSRDE